MRCRSVFLHNWLLFLDNTLLKRPPVIWRAFLLVMEASGQPGGNLYFLVVFLLVRVELDLVVLLALVLRVDLTVFLEATGDLLVA